MWDSLDRRFPTVMKYSGLAIAFYETLAEKLDRPFLLGLAGSMMGIAQAFEMLRDRSGGESK